MGYVGLAFGIAYAVTIFWIFAPWFAAAALAGIGTWAVAGEQRKMSAAAAVVVVAMCGLFTGFIPAMRAQQLNALHVKEASVFCSDTPIRVLKPALANSYNKFGIYDNSYLSPNNFQDIDSALRSRQTLPNSPLRSITLVLLKRGKPLEHDVYPVLRRVGRSSVNLSIVDRMGEIVAYSNYLYGGDSGSRARYVSCDRTPSAITIRSEDDELFALLAALAPQQVKGASD